MNENNPSHKILTQEDLKLQDLLLEDLGTIQAPVPYMEDVIDEDLRDGLTERVEREEGFKDNFGVQLDMMIQLFQSDSIEAMSKTADELLTTTKTQFAENQKEILTTIRPWEKTLRALNLFFQNASNSGKLENASFVVVDPNRFAGADNTSHFEKMAEELKNKYYAWQLKESPLFLTYAGDIGDGADLMAKIAEETVSMAIVDTIECSSAKATLARTKNRKLRGIESHWGHLVVSGTYLIGRGAHEGLEEEPLSISSAPAIAGKLMNSAEGNSIAGFENGGLVGAKGVRYPSGARESKQFGDSGMLIIGWEDGTARIFGDCTANQSSNAMSRKLSQAHNKNQVET